MTSPSVRYRYKSPDRYVMLNEGDTVVKSICLQLPKHPNIKYIDGYGLPTEEQYFRKIEDPPRLQRLEKQAYNDLKNSKDGSGRYETITSYKIHEKYWELLTKHKDSYREEIKYIKKMWWHLVNGYWFYNDGKPTWIAPQHFWYLQFMYIPKTENYQIIPHRPNYRDPDRKDAIFDWYAYTTRETFKHLDEDGNAIKKDGKYEMVEMPHRTCFGIVRPKRRRSGESMKGIIWTRYIAGMTFGGKCVITHYNEKDAIDKVYNPMLISSWNKEPFWLKPIHNVNAKAVSGLKFETPANVYNQEALESKIFVDVSSENASDGDYLNCGFFDEEGKQSKNVYEKWEINKKAMAQGANIHGFGYHPSTVEEMDEGGELFEKMFNESCFYKRDPDTGQTLSGNFRTFRKACANYDGFFDRFGHAIIGRPTRRQMRYPSPNAKYIDKGQGAREFIMNYRARLEKINTPQALNKLRKEKRKNPMDSTECFTGASGDIGFNVQILDTRIQQLDIKEETVPANFKFTAGIGSKVYMDKTPNGRWDLSLVLLDEKSNPFFQNGEKHLISKNIMIPMYSVRNPNEYIITSDTFGYFEQEINRDSGARYSDGGGAVFMRKKPSDTSQNPSDWEGYRFVATYRYRPSSLYEYQMDMLAAHFYFGGLMYFERNKENMWQFYSEHGCEDMCGYLMDENGNKSNRPGYYLQDKTQLIDALRDYIQFKGMKEKDIKLLKEARALLSPKHLTKLDRLAAAGGALVANDSVYGTVKKQETDENTIDLQDFEGMFAQYFY